MAVVTCELCERSEEPNSQSTYGFQIKSRSIRGVKRNICESCRSHIYRNKIDFVTAKKNRVKNHHRLLKSKKYVGLCECCNRDGIEVQKRSFHSGLFMKTVCTPCRDFIYKSELKDFSELRNQRIWKSKTIDRYRNSIYKIIPKHDRIIVQKDGIKNNQKYNCRRCGEMKNITNTKYLLCGSCTKKEHFIGENCQCCDRVADGTFGMTRIRDRNLIFCMNCYSKMLRYEISEVYLMELYSIKNCQICEVELVNGKLGGNSRAIDHSHISGKVRGVLCANCNKAEGYISNITDNPIIWADKLRHYLENNISNER